MYYVTDTHPLFWALFSQNRLSPRARHIFEEAGKGTHTIYIPAVVLTELMLVIERRCSAARISECLESIRLLRTAENYLFLPLMPETILSTNTLVDVPDIFDRLIVAEARRLRASLITCDQGITASGLVDAVWE